MGRNHELCLSTHSYLSKKLQYYSTTVRPCCYAMIFSPYIAPAPTVHVLSTGSQEEGSHFEASCVVYLPSPELANYTFIEWVDAFGNLILDQPRFRRQAPEYRVQILPVQQLNDTHIVRRVVVDPLQTADEGLYICQAYFAGQFLTSPNSSVTAFLEVFSKRQ